MATVIQLDKYNTFASARRKLAGAVPPVGLVVPGECAGVRRPIEMKLLRRLSEDLALDLTIISADPEIRHLANNAGLPLCWTVGGFRHRARLRGAGSLVAMLRALDYTRTLIAGLLLAALFLLPLAAVAYAVVPVMHVEIAPVRNPIQETFEVTADPKLRAIRPDTAAVPARTLVAEVEGSDQVTTTGQRNVPDARAQGRVLLTNRTNGPLVVPRGTIVSTANGVQFQTTDEVRLLASRNAQPAPIVALEPGRVGNVERQAIRTVEGPLKDQVAVSNDAPTTGGSERPANVVAPRDHERLEQGLIERLRTQALSQLRSQRGDGEVLIEPTVVVSVTEKIFSRRVDEPGNDVSLRARVQASALAYARRDIEELVRVTWQYKVGPDYTITIASLRADAPQLIEVTGNGVRLGIPVSGTAATNVDPDAIKSALRWRTAEEAMVYLREHLVLTAPPDAWIEPSWATRALRIDLQQVGAPPRR